MTIAGQQCRAQGLRYDVVDAKCSEVGSFNSERTSNGLLQKANFAQADADRKAYEASMEKANLAQADADRMAYEASLAAEKAAKAKRAAEGYRQRNAIEAARRAKARA